MYWLVTTDGIKQYKRFDLFLILIRAILVADDPKLDKVAVLHS